MEIDAICVYLNRKPAGATHAKTMKVIGKTDSNGVKRSACVQLGFIDIDDNRRLKITGRGRDVARGQGKRTQSYLDAISSFPPYTAVIAGAVRNGMFTITVPDVSSFWYERFSAVVSKSLPTRNSQSICFFYLLEGAGMGTMTDGQPGQNSQFSLDEGKARKFLKDCENNRLEPQGESPVESAKIEATDDSGPRAEEKEVRREDDSVAGRVFIIHDGSQQIRDQVNELIAFGKHEAVATQKKEISAKPELENVMNEMRSCKAAVMHAGANKVWHDDDGMEWRLISDSTLIQIGAAMALYGSNVILLVEKGVELPSALKGVRQCQYSGNEMDGAAIMTLLRTLNEFELN